MRKLNSVFFFFLCAQRLHSRYPRKFRAFYLLILLLALFYSRNLKVAIQTEDWINLKDPAAIDYLGLKSSFPREDQLTFIVPTSWEITQLCDIQKLLSLSTFDDRRVKNYGSIFDLIRPISTGTHLYFPRELPAKCEFDDEGVLLARNHPLFNLNANFDPGFLLLNFSFFDKEPPDKFGNLNFNAIEDRVKKVSDKFDSAIPGGSLFFKLSVKKGIERALLLNYVTALLLFLITFLIFRSIGYSFLLLFTIFFTTTIVRAGMAIFGHKIDPLSSGIFLLLTIAILEDAYLIFSSSIKSHFSTLFAIRKFTNSSFLTSLTTFIGFGSLAFSENQSVSRLGIWIAFGALIEWILVFQFWPCLLKSNFFKSRPKLNKNSPIHFSENHLLKVISSVKIPKSGVFALVIPVVIGWFFYHQPNINYSPFDMFKKNHQLVAYKDFLDKNKSSVGTLSLIFDEESPKSKFFQVEKEIKRNDLVTETYNPYRILHELTNGMSDPTKRLIEFESENGNFFDSLMTDSAARILVFIKKYDLLAIEKLDLFTKEICKGDCKLAGEILATKNYAFSILRTLYSSFFVSILLVLVIVLWFSKVHRIKNYLALSLAVLWAPLTLFLLINIFQLRINVVTCIALAFLVGLTGDNALQYIYHSRKSHLKAGLQKIKSTSTIICLAMLIVTTPLALSYFRSTQILWGLLMTGIILLYIGDVWILNSLLFHSKPESKRT